MGYTNVNQITLQEDAKQHLGIVKLVRKIIESCLKKRVGEMTKHKDLSKEGRQEGWQWRDVQSAKVGRGQCVPGPEMME